MITRKLSKRQGYTIQVLATQLAQAQTEATGAQEALNEMAELLRVSYELPAGEAQFGQNPDGWSLVVTPIPEPKQDDAPKPGPEETKATS